MKTQQRKPVVLITGAASGLGRALSLQLATNHRLIVVDRDREGLETLLAELADASAIHCDLADTKSIERLISEVVHSVEQIDLLINNAGITHRSLAMDTDIDVMRSVMAIDYFAPVQLTQGLRLKLSRNACVVNIGSMAGWMPVVGRAGYCAAKSALHQYFETLRAEITSRGLHILMVYPSFLDTPIEHHALDGQGGLARHKRSTTGKIRSTRWMAGQILTALDKRKARLFPDRFTMLASLLYRVLPGLYLRLMRRRLATELSGRQGSE